MNSYYLTYLYIAYIASLKFYINSNSWAIIFLYECSVYAYSDFVMTI